GSDVRRRSQPGRDLRAYMMAKTVDQARFWTEHFATPANFATRDAEPLAARWEAGDPVEVHAWELPDWASSIHHPNVRVIVTADGHVEIAESHRPNCYVIPPTPELRGASL